MNFAEFLWKIFLLDHNKKRFPLTGKLFGYGGENLFPLRG